MQAMGGYVKEIERVSGWAILHTYLPMKMEQTVSQNVGI